MFDVGGRQGEPKEFALLAMPVLYDHEAEA